MAVGEVAPPTSLPVVLLLPVLVGDKGATLLVVSSPAPPGLGAAGRGFCWAICA